jgi:hypothetical protein
MPVAAALREAVGGESRAQTTPRAVAFLLSVGGLLTIAAVRAVGLAGRAQLDVCHARLTNQPTTLKRSPGSSLLSRALLFPCPSRRTNRCPLKSPLAFTEPGSPLEPDTPPPLQLVIIDRFAVVA